MHSIAWHSMAAVSTMQRRQAALWGATCRPPCSCLPDSRAATARRRPSAAPSLLCRCYYAGEGNLRNLDDIIAASLEYYGEQGMLDASPLPLTLEKDKDARLAASPLRYPGVCAAPPGIQTMLLHLRRATTRRARGSSRAPGAIRGSVHRLTQASWPPTWLEGGSSSPTLPITGLSSRICLAATWTRQGQPPPPHPTASLALPGLRAELPSR
jgi:hypothetical protein